MRLLENKASQSSEKPRLQTGRTGAPLRKRLRQSKMFRRFLVSYLIILIIPSAAGYLSYRTSIDVTESLSIENSVTELNKSKEMLERRIAEVEGFTRQLALNPDLNALLNERPAEDGAVNVYGIWKVMNQVKPFSQTNDFLQNYYIYLRNYDIVLTKGSTYKPESYYQVSHNEHMSLDDWKSRILYATHRSEIDPLGAVVTENGRQEVVSYMQSLPLDRFDGASPGAVVVMIDERHIRSLLSGWVERYGGWVSVVDAQGRPISLQGLDQAKMKAVSSELGEDFRQVGQFREDLVITIRSDTNGWTYRAGIPSAVLMENALRIKHISWLVTGIALLLGLSAGLFLSYRNSKPLNGLLALIREQMQKEEPAGARHNEFDFLTGNISDMITANKALETEVARQQPIVRDALLKRLLSGEFQTRSEIAAAAAQSELRLEPQHGYIGVLRIDGYPDLNSVDILNELAAARLLVRQMLSPGRPLSDPVHLTDLGSDRIVIIALGDTDGDEASNAQRNLWEERITAVMNEAGDEYKMKLTAAFGGRFLSLRDISRSFEQAKQALEAVEAGRASRIVWFDDAKRETASYDYPLDVEQRLIGTVRAGEVEEAAGLLRFVMNRNKENRALIPEMKAQLINEIKGTLIKVLDQKAFLESPRHAEWRARLMDIRPAEEWESSGRTFHELSNELCASVTARQNESQLRLVERIKHFIAEHYTDQSLNLYRIAEHAERPEKYISQAFKETTGMNLSDYLEQVRMNEAVALLKENRCTVDDISARVGYNSSHSFRRAFKRVMGVSPSAYRQLAP